MKQTNQPCKRSITLLQKGPQTFFREIIQLSQQILAQEEFRERLQIRNNEINQKGLRSRQCKKKGHLNQPLKHLLTILEHQSCLPQQFEQQ